MLWMETYLFYCSVRLGVLVVALLVFVQVYVPCALLLVMGMDAMKPVIQLFENDSEYGKSPIVRKIIRWIENRVNMSLKIYFLHSHLSFFLQNLGAESDEHGERFHQQIKIIESGYQGFWDVAMMDVQAFIALAVSTQTIHMISSGLAIFGALKLKKYFLLPFIVTEFFRVIACFALHIILMIILKKKLNLGFLIFVTLAGGFAILYLGYNWATSVALYQIIELIHTERYRQLYGDDPFNPQLPPSYGTYTPPPGYGTVENVHVLTTPRSSDIDAQKQRQTQGVVRVLKAQQPVIAVLPANYKNKDAQYQFNNLQQRSQQQKQQYRRYESQQNDYNTEFGNWQWSELMIGRQRKPVISRNW